jgi:hypothetical protein
MKYQRNARVESAPMTDETLLYEPKSVKFCALNSTGAYIWERLEMPRSVPELADDLSTAYRLEDRSQVEQQLQSFLDEFVRLSFVAADAAPNGNGEYQSHESGSGQPREPHAIQAYGPPAIRLMDESEVLTAFQITSAGISWWAM